MTLSTKFNFRDSTGARQEAEVAVTDYAAAADAGLSLSQYLARKFPTDEKKYGSILSQALTSTGVNLNSDPSLGIQSSTMKDIMNASINMGAITSPSGSDSTPAGRIFLPEVILQTISSKLTEDKSDFFRGYESLLSGTENVNAPEFKRPIIDITAPEGSESQSTAQLAEPASMVSITAANSTTPIPTKAIGLMVSEQAIANTTLDLVNTVMGRQAYGERVRMVTNQLADVIGGNADLGLTPLSSVTAASLDATSTSIDNFSQKAWIHFLRDNYETMTVTNVMCTIDTALAIEGRTGKPTNQNDDPNSPRIDSLFNVDNLGIVAPKVFLVPDTVVANGTLVGLDNAYALRRYVNVSASYDAIESFVMRRAKAFRVDHGETVTRLYDDAFRVVTM